MAGGSEWIELIEIQVMTLGSQSDPTDLPSIYNFKSNEEKIHPLSDLGCLVLDGHRLHAGLLWKLSTLQLLIIADLISEYYFNPSICIVEFYHSLGSIRSMLRKFQLCFSFKLL